MAQVTKAARILEDMADLGSKQILKSGIELKDVNSILHHANFLLKVLSFNQFPVGTHVQFNHGGKGRICTGIVMQQKQRRKRILVQLDPAFVKASPESPCLVYNQVMVPASMLEKVKDSSDSKAPSNQQKVKRQASGKTKDQPLDQDEEDDLPLNQLACPSKRQKTQDNH